MQRRRPLILIGFLLALVAMLPVTALAGAWAVVCTTGDGASHIELAHQSTGCEHDAEKHAPCVGDKHDHPPVPCEDRALDLDNFRVSDRPSDLSSIDLPLPVLLYAALPQPIGTLTRVAVGPHLCVCTGPPPGVTTTVLRL